LELECGGLLGITSIFKPPFKNRRPQATYLGGETWVFFLIPPAGIFQPPRIPQEILGGPLWKEAAENNGWWFGGNQPPRRAFKAGFWGHPHMLGGLKKGPPLLKTIGDRVENTGLPTQKFPPPQKFLEQGVAPPAGVSVTTNFSAEEEE